MTGKKWILLIALAFFVLLPIYSESLDSIINQAKQNSPTIRLITLNKANTDLTIAQRELKSKFGITVDSGEITFSDLADKPTIALSPSVGMSFPTKDNTKLTFSVPNLSWTISDSNNSFSAIPTITFSKSLKIGDSGDNLDDLETARQRIDLEKKYQQGILDFESSIYSKIVEILNYEMTLLNNEKDIYVQQTKIDNTKALKTIALDSTAFKSMELELDRLINTKNANLKKLEMAYAQFKQLTDLEYTEVEDIREASLDFKTLALGDSSVLLASLDLEIAKENLALRDRASVKTSVGSTVPSLNLTANSSINYSKSDILGEKTSYNVGLGATYLAKNFSTGAGIKLDINDSGSIKPTFSVSGSWSNNSTEVRDDLETQKLENSITIASINYQQAVLDYQIKANQLEVDLLNFNLNMQRFEQSVELRHQLFEQTLQSFDRGLAKQTDVDLARLDIELIKYEQKINALQALILENRIKSLQL